MVCRPRRRSSVKIRFPVSEFCAKVIIWSLERLRKSKNTLWKQGNVWLANLQRTVRHSSRRQGERKAQPHSSSVKWMSAYFLRDSKRDM